MMPLIRLESVTLGVALGGSFLAGLWDLKTTEVPDPLLFAMIGAGIVIAAIQSFLYGSYWYFLNSLAAGGALLAFGAVMYFFGQWGGADALLLASIGFLLPRAGGPNLLFPFPFSYLLNVFLIGAAYMLIYAFILALRNGRIVSQFFKEMKASAKILLVGSAGLFLIFLGINYYLFSLFNFLQLSTMIMSSLLPLIIFIVTYTVLKFAKVVEKVGFRKKVHISRLKVGDVLAEEKFWRGITEVELRTLKASKRKFVWIKEGVRFAPVFFLALIFTLWYGDGIFLLSKFILGL